MKMTNGEASKLLAPAVDKMFDDPERKFPVTDAFMLLKALETIRAGMEAYRKSYKAICDSHNVEIDQKTQQMGYPTREDAQAAAAEIKELNEIEVHFEIKKIKAKIDWPPLTLAEMLCLESILDTSDLE